MASELHEERLDAVVRHLLCSGATRVIDLGCAGGELLLRLARQPQFTRIVGIDIDTRALRDARGALGLCGADPDPRIQVRYGSFEEADDSLTGFDAAALIETIEHVDPRRLHRVEAAVFGAMRPGMVLVTTPNREYNGLHGLAPGERRHPGHRFEWTRDKFRRWAHGVARRCRYRPEFFDLGPAHPVHGSSTQMARFVRGE